jgi:hypothetical protein
MIDYKYPTISSGATPIGSAGHTPDEKLYQQEREGRTWKKNSSPLSVVNTRYTNSKFTPIERSL